jgi:autotransporter-associated beta strand protein
MLLVLCVSSPLVLRATDGTWTKTNTTTELWSTTADWLNGTVADGVGATANFTPVQGGTSRTVNIDTTSQTVGIMNIYNQHSNVTSSQSYIFGTTTGNTLTFDNGASAAQLNITNGASTGGGTNTFSLDVRLGSSLTIANNRSLSTNTLLFSGAISASSSGTKTITNSSTGPAPVTISGLISDGSGTVAIRQNSATSTLTLSGTNSYTGGTAIDAGTVSISADLNLGAISSGVSFNGGTLTTTASIITDAARSATFNAGGGTLNAANFLNWGGIIAGSGQLIKTGANTLSINNINNTHTGGIRVDAGVIRFRYGDGSFGGAGNGVTLASGTSLLIQDAYTAGAGRNLALTSGTVNFDIRSDFTWNGTVSGSGGLTKVGTATLVLGGTNSYSGGTLINAGSVSFAADANLGATTSGVTLDGGNLIASAGVITDAARTATINAGGGTITADAFLNWEGVVSGTGLLTKAGTNTLSLNNVNNTHSGNIKVDAGSLRIRFGDGSFGAAGNSVTFADTTTFRTQDTFTAGSGRSLTLTSGNVTFNIINNLTWAGTVVGAGGMTKIGTGNLILNGTNSYSGTTSITGGGYIVNGSIASAITAETGTTFGGSGSSSAAVTLNAGSTLVAGNNGIGTFTTSSNLALNSATYAVEFNSTLGTFDKTLAGNVALSSAILTLTDLGSGSLTQGTVYTILDNTGGNSVTGTFFNLVEGATVASGNTQFTISYLGGSGNDITLTVTASTIPEASSYAILAALASIGAAAFRRRRS